MYNYRRITNWECAFEGDHANPRIPAYIITQENRSENRIDRLKKHGIKLVIHRDPTQKQKNLSQCYWIISEYSTGKRIYSSQLDTHIEYNLSTDHHRTVKISRDDTIYHALNQIAKIDLNILSEMIDAMNHINR